MSKIVLLAGANSIHTIRWANGLKLAGHDVYLISQHCLMHNLVDGIKYFKLPVKGIIGYFLNVSQVKKIIQEIKPDIVNAHYASGYGTTARLVNFHPYVLSVWGADVYDFPNKSFIHLLLVKKNLKAADKIASTSHCMARQTQKILPSLKEISITPFGVETSIYNNIEETNKNDGQLVIGTVKTMADKYGIDILIDAFYLLYTKLVKNKSDLAEAIQLRLVGGGPQLQNLKLKVSQLGLDRKVCFVGQIPHEKVVEELSNFDIYVALSRLDSESFGVAIIEASAAGLPVVVSDVGGLPEVTINNVTGFVVPRENPVIAASAIEKLVLDPELRVEMGMKGKLHVKKHYDWDACIKTMENVYNETVKGN